MRGKLFVLSGPGGAGKGTVLQAAASLDATIWIGPSMTTRSPRPNEVPFDYEAEFSRTKAYHFVDDVTFEATYQAGGFLEADGPTHGKRYGTLRQPVVERINAGLPVLLEIEVLGAATLRRTLPNKTLPKPFAIFLKPPSESELERRLGDRGNETPETIAARLAQGRRELMQARYYDHVIINDDVQQAAEDLICVMRKIQSEA